MRDGCWSCPWHAAAARGPAADGAGARRAAWRLGAIWAVLWLCSGVQAMATEPCVQTQVQEMLLRAAIAGVTPNADAMEMLPRVVIAVATPAACCRGDVQYVAIGCCGESGRQRRGSICVSSRDGVLTGFAVGRAGSKRDFGRGGFGNERGQNDTRIYRFAHHVSNQTQRANPRTPLRVIYRQRPREATQSMVRRARLGAQRGQAVANHLVRLQAVRDRSDDACTVSTATS